MAGLAIGGAEGVAKLITGTNEELRRVMSLTGCFDLKGINSELIWSQAGTHVFTNVSSSLA